MRDPLVNYLRAQRKRTGLSQEELASLLGYASKDAISQHELFKSVPPLIMAFGYEVIFQAPMSELFAGLRDAVELSVQKELLEFERKLLKEVQKSRSRRPSAVLLHKLEWLKRHPARRLSSDLPPPKR